MTQPIQLHLATVTPTETYEDKPLMYVNAVPHAGDYVWCSTYTYEVTRVVHHPAQTVFDVPEVHVYAERHV